MQRDGAVRDVGMTAGRDAGDAKKAMADAEKSAFNTSDVLGRGRLNDAPPE